MKRILKLILIFLHICIFCIGQENEKDPNQYVQSFVGSDTILLGNIFEYKVELKNIKGDFEPPEFRDFDIVGGPNISSSMSFVNGKLSNKRVYSYILKPRKPGQYFIEESFVVMEAETINTEAIPIFVLDNPENIKKDYKIDSTTPSWMDLLKMNPENKEKHKKKPKRKLKKI